MHKKRFQRLLKRLYEVVADLEQMFPGRPFTPDGHMVGSLGECLASYHYGLELLPPTEQTHDARKNGLFIQIKATQGDRVSLRSEPQHLLVLRINNDGTFKEFYNGRGHRVWVVVSKKPRPSNGQYPIGLPKLRRLMESVPLGERLPLIRR